MPSGDGRLRLANWILYGEDSLHFKGCWKIEGLRHITVRHSSVDKAGAQLIQARLPCCVQGVSRRRTRGESLGMCNMYASAKCEYGCPLNRGFLSLHWWLLEGRQTYPITRKHYSRMRTFCFADRTCFSSHQISSPRSPQVDKFEQVSSPATMLQTGWGRGLGLGLRFSLQWGSMSGVGIDGFKGAPGIHAPGPIFFSFLFWDKLPKIIGWDPPSSTNWIYYCTTVLYTYIHRRQKWLQ